MLLYIIRHGDPDYEHDTLTELGRAQSAALADRLAVHGLDRIYCSPLGRARATAEPTCRKLGLEMQIEEWCSESIAASRFWVNYPDYSAWIYQQNGANFRSPENEAHFQDWQNLDCLQNLDPDHAYDLVSKASDAFMERLGYRREGARYRVLRANNDRVALFCHEGFTMTWMPHLLQIPPQIWWAHFAYSHTGINILQFENPVGGFTVPRILVWSDLSHIFHDGKLPLRYNNGIDI